MSTQLKTFNSVMQEITCKLTPTVLHENVKMQIQFLDPRVAYGLSNKITALNVFIELTSPCWAAHQRASAWLQNHLPSLGTVPAPDVLLLKSYAADKLYSLAGLVSGVCNITDSLAGLVWCWFEAGLSVWRIRAVVPPKDIVLWRLFFRGSGGSPDSLLLMVLTRRLTMIRCLLRRN